MRYWVLNRTMGLDGLALASSIAITVYTALLAVAWYRRTGTEQLRPVFRTTMRNAPLAAGAGVIAWVAARAILSALGTDGFWANGLAAAAAGTIVLALTLLPPAVRHDLRQE